MSQGSIERLSPSSETGRPPGLRQRIFVRTAGLVLLLGAVYTALQPAEFSSSASVLISSMPAIDASPEEADLQGLAIQRHRLLGVEIVEELSRRLRRDRGFDVAPQQLRGMLRVDASEDTSLLDLRAVGSEREQLPLLVEDWIDVYGNVRAEDIRTRKSETLLRVEEELAALQDRVTDARLALDAFRAEHGIVSMDRQQNAVLSRLDGLNRSLNRATDEEVRAQARLQTLRQAIADGTPVVPGDEQSEVSAMARQLSTLRARLSELRIRYTQDYIDKDPRLRQIPVQIAELEQALEQAYRMGAQTELINAERDFRTARESVTDLKQRLEDQKSEAAAFTSVYATHQALVADLGRLEGLYRETQARLVQVDVLGVEKYPQLSIVSPPAPIADRIGPDYLLLAGASLLLATVLGIFAVWLHGFLNPAPREPTLVAVAGVPLYSPEQPAALAAAAGDARLAADPPAARLSDGQSGQRDEPDAEDPA